MTTSVIIPSFNGAKRLPNLIHALENQSDQAFNTLLVLDGSTDGSKKSMEALQPQLNLHIIEQDNRGRAGARNAGAYESKDELLIFVDDDMRPSPGFVEQHRQHHMTKPHSALTGRQEFQSERAETDFQHYLAHRSSQWMEGLSQGKILMTRKQLFFTAANCSMPRNIFKSVGGFDEHLRDAEDFELATRLFERDIPIYFDYNCLAWHDDLINLSEYITRRREYLQAWQSLTDYKPHVVSDYYRFKDSNPKGVRKAFFKVLASPLWVRFAEHSPAFHSLPRKLRFRMYDYIVASLGRYNTQVEIN